MLRTLLTLSIAVFVATIFALVNTNVSGQEQTSPPVRILLVVGGHGYDKVNLHKMLEAIPNAKLTEITLPKNQDQLGPETSKNYDVVVFHDQSQFKLTDAQQKNLETMWANGMPTVMLHHALISHNDVPLFRKVFGTAYLIKPRKIDGKEYSTSSYLKPTDVRIHFVDKTHPAVKGLSDFTLNDEVFSKLYIAPDVNILAKTDHPKSDKPVVWTNQYKKSRVFVVIQGHDGNAFNDANYRQLIRQGILWTIGK